MQAASTGRNSLRMNDSFSTRDFSESTSSSTTTTRHRPSRTNDSTGVRTSGSRRPYRANPCATDPITVRSEGFHVICSRPSDSLASMSGMVSISEKLSRRNT